MGKTEQNLTYSHLERCRWNVLDLLTVVGKNALPATLFCDVDMGWIEELKKSYLNKHIRITETAVLLKAIATAQVHHEDSRTIMLPFGRLVIFEKVCAGFTVERFVDEVPTVFFGAIDEPHTKNLPAIMDELVTFSEKSLSNQPQLSMEDRVSRMPWLLRQSILRMALLVPKLRLRISASTFGLSSLGKFGANAITGPCVCTSTFGVGMIEDRAIVKDGQIIVRPMMTLSYLFDQRCIDGGNAARFLADVKDLLEGGLAKHLNEERANCRHLLILPSTVRHDMQ